MAEGAITLKQWADSDSHFVALEKEVSLVKSSLSPNMVVSDFFEDKMKGYYFSNEVSYSIFPVQEKSPIPPSAAKPASRMPASAASSASNGSSSPNSSASAAKSASTDSSDLYRPGEETTPAQADPAAERMGDATTALGNSFLVEVPEEKPDKEPEKRANNEIPNSPADQKQPDSGEKPAPTESESENQAPTAVDDEYTVASEEAYQISIRDLLKNDHDPEGKKLLFLGLQNTHLPQGLVEDNGDGTLTYVPPAGFVGVDAFAYTISDGARQAYALVSLNVVSGPALEELVSKHSQDTASVTIEGEEIQALEDHLYLAFISYSQSSNHVQNMQGLGLTWSLLDEQCAGSASAGLEVWYAIGHPTDSEDLRANLNNSSAQAHLVVSRWSGVDATNPVQSAGKANSNGNGAMAACAGATPSKDVELTGSSLTEGSYMVSATVFSNENNSIVQDDSGDIVSTLNSGSNPNGLNTAISSQESQSIGAESFEATLGLATRWAALSVEIRPRP